MAEQIFQETEKVEKVLIEDTTEKNKSKCGPNLVLGKTLKRYRQQSGLTQKDVAKIVGISTTQYNHYENGTFSPDYMRILAISKAINCDPIALLTTAIISIEKDEEVPLEFFKRTSEALRDKVNHLSSLSVVF